MSWFTTQPDTILNRDESDDTSGPTAPDATGGSDGGTSREQHFVGYRQPSILEYGGLNGMEEIPVTFEEPWNDNNEDELRGGQVEAETAASAHNAAGYRLKFKYNLGGFISIIWGMIVLIANGMLSCDDQVYSKFLTVFINSVNVTIIAVFSKMNLGQAYQEHFDYEARFLKVSDDINYVLGQERDFRVPADAFRSGILERVKNLRSAPELPKSRYFFC